MAVTQSLMIGVLTTMLDDVIYALPPKVVRLYTSTAGATFQCSNDVAMAATTAVTLTDGSAEVAAAFIRSTAADALVVIKPLV